MNRMELTGPALEAGERYKKIVADTARLDALLVDLFLDWHGSQPRAHRASDGGRRRAASSMATRCCCTFSVGLSAGRWNDGGTRPGVQPALRQAGSWNCCNAPRSRAASRRKARSSNSWRAFTPAPALAGGARRAQSTDGGFNDGLVPRGA